MTGIGNINLKVLVMDTDFYALQAVNSYLAWDRRTRVTFLAEDLDQMWAHINTTPPAELPDVVLLDTSNMSATSLKSLITRLYEAVPNCMVICQSQIVEPEMVEAAAESEANAYLLKQDVRLKIAWAIVYALDHDFVITQGVRGATNFFQGRIFRAAVLPEQREYPELTDRIRQAIKLCVVEGMPAHLAADEMGISLHTIRGYVKEGYRILEAYDENDYPVDMTPQERAFMRFTALADETDDQDVNLTGG